MKTNRREFVKGALSGIFGAVLTLARYNGSYYHVGSDATIDDLSDGPFTWHAVYDQWGNLVDSGIQCWDGQARGA